MARPLTLPDLVVLALVAERPMHGYELNQELERRDARDWAGISRPQVYYSLRKLAESGHLLRATGGDAGSGPERQVWRLGAAGRRALAEALARPEWAEQRPPPPFLTWMALSHFADPAERRRQLARRRDFLAREIARERRTLEAVRADPGPQARVAEPILDLVLRQWAVEVEWLDQLLAPGSPGDESRPTVA